MKRDKLAPKIVPKVTWKLILATRDLPVMAVAALETPLKTYLRVSKQTTQTCKATLTTQFWDRPCLRKKRFPKYLRWRRPKVTTWRSTITGTSIDCSLRSSNKNPAMTFTRTFSQSSLFSVFMWSCSTPRWTALSRTLQQCFRATSSQEIWCLLSSVSS